MEAAGNLFENESSAEKIDYKPLKVLGKGSFGTVFLVKKNEGNEKGKLFAVKGIMKVTDPLKTSFIKSEIEVLTTIRQQNFLLNLHYFVETEEAMYLFLDYIPGNNLSYYVKRRIFCVKEVRFYVDELVLALEYLHGLGIIHRDIKLDNVMIDNEGHIVLADFGLAKDLSGSDGVRKVKTIYRVGTSSFMSPEVVKCRSYGMPSDWWAVGILMNALFTRKRPFDALTLKKTQHRIKRKNPAINPHLTVASKDLILKLLNKNQDERLGSNGGADEIKEHEFFAGIDWELLKNRGYRPLIVPNVELPELEG